MNKQNDEITIKELINIFIPKIWLIVLVAVVCAVLLGGYSVMFEKDTYTSKASFIMVKIPTQYNTSDGKDYAVTTGLNESEISAMQSMIAMSEQVMETSRYLATVKEELVRRDEAYEDVSIGQLKNMLSIAIVGSATCFDVAAVSTDPTLSYHVTDIVHDTLADEIEYVFASYSITIKDIDPPVEAISPDGKNTVRNALIGFLAGALLTMVIVFIVNKLDVVIRSRDKIETNFNIPIIGTIPRFENDN